MDVGLQNSELVGVTTIEGELHFSARDTSFNGTFLGVNCVSFVCILFDEEFEIQVT